jgi:MFS family permease
VSLCFDIDPALSNITPTSISGLVASIPLGWLADRYSRVRILWLGLMVWSAATLCSSFVTSFYQLAIARMALGVGQAAVSPTAFSVLSDFFAPSLRGRVLSAFSSMIYVGQVFGILTGALSQSSSWRIAFLVLGLPGLALGVPFILTVFEPKRGLFDSKSKQVDAAAIANDDDIDALHQASRLAASRVAIPLLVRVRYICTHRVFLLYARPLSVVVASNASCHVSVR